MKPLPVIQPPAPKAPETGPLQTAGMVNDAARSAELRPRIIKALSTVFDPELPVNIYELGLIYDVLVDAGANKALADRDGVTALQHARAKGYAQIVALLQ